MSDRRLRHTLWAVRPPCRHVAAWLAGVVLCAGGVGLRAAEIGSVPPPPAARLGPPSPTFADPAYAEPTYAQPTFAYPAVTPARPPLRASTPLDPTNWSAAPARYAPARAEPWCWQLMPQGLMYRSYLAGGREPRFAGNWIYEREQGWIWDVTLGGRVGILRHGTCGPADPEGWQLDMEGAAFPRLSADNDLDLTGVDFRFGIPVTHAAGRWQHKLAFYHLSSHIGDEFLPANPGFQRINFSRNVIVMGAAYMATDELRLYAETGYGFHADEGTEPWEFQFGADYAPAGPTGFAGAPFAAVNGHLRQEVDFGGNLIVMAGWAWRGSPGGSLFRAGVRYFNGKSIQFEFYDQFEESIGMGLWYDY